jgi:hypothetical protein
MTAAATHLPPLAEPVPLAALGATGHGLRIDGH